MDADGNCLVVSPCFACKQAKNGVQVCLVRKHNARLTAVKVDDLTSRHRQCVKPDQSMTIFKLVDRETGEESVEYAKDMVFQRPCEGCQHLKSCIVAGHPLLDWVAEGNDSRISKRKSMSSAAKSAGAHSPAAGNAHGSSRGKGAATAAGVPSSAEKGTSPPGAAATKTGGGRRESGDGNHRPKRRKFDASRSNPAPAGEGAANAVDSGDAASSKMNNKANALAKDGGAKSSGGSKSPAGRGGSNVGASAGAGAIPGSVTTAQTIAVRLEEMSAAEDLLRQQFQADMHNLEKAEMAKLKEIEDAKAALERIRLIRKATREKTAEQRKDMSTERQRLTHLRVKAIIREEEELRRRNEALWTACEASTDVSWGSTPSCAAAATFAPAVNKGRAGGRAHPSARQVPPKLHLPGLAGGALAPNGCPSSMSLAQSVGGAVAAGGLDVTSPWSSLSGVVGERGDGDAPSGESDGEEDDINVEGGGTHEEGTGTGDGPTGGVEVEVESAVMEVVGAGEGSGRGGGWRESSGGRNAGNEAAKENGSISAMEEGDDNTAEKKEWMLAHEGDSETPGRGTDEFDDVKEGSQGEKEGSQEGGLGRDMDVVHDPEVDEVEVRGSADEAPSEVRSGVERGGTDNAGEGGSDAKTGRRSDSSGSGSCGRGSEIETALQQTSPSGGTPAEGIEDEEGVDGEPEGEVEESAGEEERVDVGDSPFGGGGCRDDQGGEGVTTR